MLTRQEGLIYYLSALQSASIQLLLFNGASGFATDAAIASFIATEPLPETGYTRNTVTVSAIAYDSLNSQVATNALSAIQTAAASPQVITFDSLGVLIGGAMVSATAITAIASSTVTSAGHGLSAGDQVVFTGAVSAPTGLAMGTGYYVIAGGLTSSDFKIAATSGGAALAIGSSFSGDLYVRSCKGTLIHWQPRPDNGLGSRTYTINSAQSNTISCTIAMKQL